MAAYRANTPHYPDNEVTRLRDPARPNDPPIVGPDIGPEVLAELSAGSAFLDMAPDVDPDLVTSEHPQWLVTQTFPDGTWRKGALWDAEEVTEWLGGQDFSTSSRVYIERRPEGFPLT